MKLNTQEKGFGVVGVVVVVLVLAVVGATGSYVWHKHNTGKIKPTPVAKSAPKSNPIQASTTTYTFPIEKMMVTYDKSWKVSRADQGENPCGKTDGLVLANNGFTLNFDFGTICGKGSAGCFEDPDSDCKTESENIATVQLSTDSQAYILAYRTRVDSNDDWRYAVSLVSEPECHTDFCTFVTRNMGTNAGGSSISGGLDLTGRNVDSLDTFAALPEVKEAVKVLETAHY